MRWVTRNYPGVDRTASAWLIKKFIDPDAEFIFIKWPEEKPLPEHGTLFDIKGADLGHRNGKCTFETILEKYSLKNPYLSRVAEIVHAADIEEDIDKVPEARGIKAVFSGLRFVADNDYETLEIGMKIWEAIYTNFKLKDIIEKHRDKLDSMGRLERLEFLKSGLRK